MDIYGLHHNKKQWIDHDQFIPERFDPSSPYALTPTGEKRDTFSFLPFIGGKRVCLGKSFADLLGRTVLSSLVHAFDFEFEDDAFMTKFAIHNLLTNKPAPVVVKVAPRKSI